ncbi:MAG: ABC transporter permease [Bacteroidia bacterium]|nr:ABC transporter permease [Bacteroidia bacterium]
MIKFIFKRLLQGLLVIWGITTLLFFIFSVLGDPAQMIAGQRSDLDTEEAIRKQFYLDKPLVSQYLLYLNDLSPVSWLSQENPNFDSYSYQKLIGSKTAFLALKAPFFRRSFQTNREVSAMLAEKLPGTFILALSSIVLASFVGIFLGVIASQRLNSWFDRAIIFSTMLGISAPSFFMGVLIIWVFAVLLGDFTQLPVTGYLVEETPFGTSWQWSTLILPSIALGIRPLAIITQLTRSSMIDVQGMDFVRTARAKGLKERVVLFRHTLRNALNPVATSISSWFASLLAGAFFIEYIFGWQGIGKLTIEALSKNDYPVILGAAIFIGFIFVLVNLSVDVLYTRLDPRVKIG